MVARINLRFIVLKGVRVQVPAQVYNYNILMRPNIKNRSKKVAKKNLFKIKIKKM